MSTGRGKAIAAFIAVFVGELLLFWLDRWSTWRSVALPVLTGTALLVVVTRVYPRAVSSPVLVSEVPAPPLPEEPLLPPLPPERRGVSVSDVLLPSDRDDYCFLLSATVLWLPVRAVAEAFINMDALAVDAVLRRAREITGQRDPGNVSLVRYELGRALGEMREEPTGCLWAMAESVRLVLPEKDQQRLDKLAAVRKDEDVWEHERKYEQSKREYLGDDVLKDAGSAVVWWLARNDDQVEKTVQDIGLLTQLSCAANNAQVPRPDPLYDSGTDGWDVPRHPDGEKSDGEKSAADHFGAFLAALGFDADDPQRAHFARRVADLAAWHQRQEVADELKRRFDAPDGSGQSGEDGGTEEGGA